MSRRLVGNGDPAFRVCGRPGYRPFHRRRDRPRTWPGRAQRRFGRKRRALRQGRAQVQRLPAKLFSRCFPMMPCSPGATRELGQDHPWRRAAQPVSPQLLAKDRHCQRPPSWLGTPSECRGRYFPQSAKSGRPEVWRARIAVRECPLRVESGRGRAAAKRTSPMAGTGERLSQAIARRRPLVVLADHCRALRGEQGQGAAPQQDGL